jgi:hypothetical protein
MGKVLHYIPGEYHIVTKHAEGYFCEGHEESYEKVGKLHLPNDESSSSSVRRTIDISFGTKIKDIVYNREHIFLLAVTPSICMNRGPFSDVSCVHK